MASKETVPAAAAAQTTPLLVVMIGLVVLAIVLIFVAALVPRRLHIDISGAINAMQRGDQELRALNAVHTGQKVAARRAGAASGDAPQALAGAVRTAGMSVSTTKTALAGGVGAVADPKLAPKHAVLLATGAADIKDPADVPRDAVVLVHMDGCGPCRYMRQTLAAMDGPLPVPVVAIERKDYAAAREALAALGVDDVTAFPTLFLLRGGRAARRRVGALSEPALRAWVAAAGEDEDEDEDA